MVPRKIIDGLDQWFVICRCLIKDDWLTIFHQFATHCQLLWNSVGKYSNRGELGVTYESQGARSRFDAATDSCLQKHRIAPEISLECPP